MEESLDDNNQQHNLISNVTIENPSTNSTYVNIKLTIALAVPAGKFIWLNRPPLKFQLSS